MPHHHRGQHRREQPGRGRQQERGQQMPAVGELETAVEHGLHDHVVAGLGAYPVGGAVPVDLPVLRHAGRGHRGDVTAQRQAGGGGAVPVGQGAVGGVEEHPAAGGRAGDHAVLDAVVQLQADLFLLAVAQERVRRRARHRQQHADREPDEQPDPPAGPAHRPQLQDLAHSAPSRQSRSAPGQQLHGAPGLWFHGCLLYTKRQPRR